MGDVDVNVDIRPSSDRPGLGHNERIRDGVDVLWPGTDGYRLYGDARYRRANGAVMAATGLLGIVEGACTLVGPDESLTSIPAGVWALYRHE